MKTRVCGQSPLLWFLLALVLVAKTMGQSVPIYSSIADSTADLNSTGVNPPGKSRSCPRAGSSRGNASYSFLEPLSPSQNCAGWPSLKHVVDDQTRFWTAPARLEKKDAKWGLPLLAFSGALIASDRWISQQVPDKPSQLQRSQDFSNYALYSLVGTAGGSYLWGLASKNEHRRETGFLAAEAVVNSTAVTYAFKTLAQRERPFAAAGQGHFFAGGGSFPSEHAAAAWSIASLVAYEYPGPLTKFLAYGLASGVTVARVTSQRHFPSDVFVASLLGWYMGRQTYRAHHDPELDGAWFGESGDEPQSEPEHESQENVEKGSRNPANMGSPYVPLDSWVYRGFDRLIALGYVRTALIGMRPWTRLECVRLLHEASDGLRAEDSSENEGDKGAARDALRLYDSLAQEFSPDRSLRDGGKNLDLRVESIYSRITGIAGRPLTDGYHFGQTVANDYGRPFGSGFSSVEGFSGWASAGPLTAYLRGEYQHAPSLPVLSTTARQFLATADDNLPVPPGLPRPAVNRFQWLDAYVALNAGNWQFAFGKQSLWWGPSRGGPVVFSDNAAPVTMFRIDRVAPFKLPGVLDLLGPMRWQFVLGRLSGHEFVWGAATGLIGQWGRSLSDQPFLVGQKFNFKPTPNFEFGIDYTRIAGGPGQPFTFRQFLKSTFSLGNGPPGTASDPGDIRSGVDFSYRVPGLRDSLTFYGDAFTEDEFSPLAYPRKSAFQGGIYLAGIPRLPKLDLRVEGGSTSPVDFPTCNGCFYQNTRFVNAYTNQGSLMGSWVGRASQGEQIWSTYWLSPRNTVSVSYRHRQLDAQFVPQGGAVNDGSARAEFWLSAGMKLSSSVQYERWAIPVLDSPVQSNLTVMIEFSLWPRDWSWHGRSR